MVTGFLVPPRREHFGHQVPRLYWLPLTEIWPGPPDMSGSALKKEGRLVVDVYARQQLASPLSGQSTEFRKGQLLMVSAFRAGVCLAILPPGTLQKLNRDRKRLLYTRCGDGRIEFAV